MDAALEKDGLEKLVEKARKIITDNGGKISKMEEWGKRALSYLLKKQTVGVYYFFNLELEPAKLKGLEGKIKIENGVLRHLLVKKD